MTPIDLRSVRSYRARIVWTTRFDVLQGLSRSIRNRVLAFHRRYTRAADAQSLLRCVKRGRGYLSLSMRIIRKYIWPSLSNHFKCRRKYGRCLVCRLFRVLLFATIIHGAVESAPHVFHYDISPVKVVVQEESEALAAFVTKICAVIGGIYTVVGLLDSVMYHSVQSFSKKK